MRLWRPEGPIPESFEDKRMCKDPSLNVRPRAWATRVTNSSPVLGFPPLQCMQCGSSQELITPQPTGLCRAPRPAPWRAMAQQGCLREGLSRQLLSTILTPAGPDLQGEEWSGREGSIIPRLLLPFLAASVCL